jgi:hypothetical protein
MGTKQPITEVWNLLDKEAQRRIFVRAADDKYTVDELVDMIIDETLIVLKVRTHRYLSQRVDFVPRREMATVITISTEDFWKLYGGVDDRK